MKILRVFSWLLLVAAMPVLSQPVQVSESEFEVLAAEMPRTIEDFNRFPSGDIASPVALRNSQFTGAPSIGAPWCLSSPCLTINLTASVFSSLTPGTQLWSARLIPAGSSSNVYDFDVVGGGGTQRFTFTDIEFSAQGTFLGFQDPQGIQQVTVSLRTGGIGINYSLDDVTVVAGPTAHQSVPVGGPAAYVLLGLMLFAIGALVLRNR